MKTHDVFSYGSEELSPESYVIEASPSTISGESLAFDFRVTQSMLSFIYLTVGF